MISLLGSSHLKKNFLQSFIIDLMMFIIICYFQTYLVIETGNYPQVDRFNMNFARATKGTLTKDGLLREIDCQSELELGRHLDSSEKTVLFSRFSPEKVVSRIEQVCNLLKAFLFFQIFNFCSMAMVY